MFNSSSLYAVIPAEPAPVRDCRNDIYFLTGFFMEKQPCVYLLASCYNGTLYVGVTSDLVKRVYQHRNNQVDGFTKRYNVHNLVWYELHEQMESAILREKQIKKWSRKAKIGLIEQRNSAWADLWHGLL